MAETSVPLQTLYSRALKTASKASSLPTIEDDTQKLVEFALADMYLLSSRVGALHLFSTNETLEEVSTRDLLYMTVPFILAELELGARSIGRENRLARLRMTQAHFKSFTSLLDAYGVLPVEEKELYNHRNSSITDPAKRREIKIAQFKKEKEIKNRISALRTSRRLPEIDMLNAYDIVESALPSSGSEDEDSEDTIRETITWLLRLQWAQTSAHRESIDQELELLANTPLEDSRSEPLQKSSEDDEWRLDAPSGSLLNRQGPLLDVSGKPLRPFTILPAGSSERARLQDEVFRPDYRLPTMSIDEYLEEERCRGNIITGGGPQSAAAPTRKEQLAIDAEMEGSRRGEEKAEEKRLEDERWAQFTDANPRGAGNTMNRG